MVKRWKEREPILRQGLLERSSSEEEENKKGAAPKGYVPILVGKEGETERVLVHVGHFSDPCIVVLLEMAADELGYRQEGILRLPCDAYHFRRVVKLITKSK